MTPSARRWWISAFVVLVFLAGTAAGVIVDRLWLLRRPAIASGQVRLADGQRPLPAVPANRLVGANLMRLRNRLDLTPAQEEQVRPLLESWQARVVDLQRRTRDQLLMEVRQLEEALAPILTPDQRTRLAEARSVLLMPAAGRGRMTGPDGGRGGRGSSRGRE